MGSYKKILITITISFIISGCDSSIYIKNGYYLRDVDGRGNMMFFKDHTILMPKVTKYIVNGDIVYGLVSPPNYSHPSKFIGMNEGYFFINTKTHESERELELNDLKYILEKNGLPLEI